MAGKSVIKEIKSSLTGNLKDVIQIMINGIADDLDSNLSEINEDNSDGWGNKYYQGSSRELLQKLGLVDSENRLTGKAQELYREFQKKGFYTEES